MKHFRRNSTISLQGLFKKRQNPKTRQNRDNTHENDKKEGYKKNQNTEGKQIHINETTQKLKHLHIFHARELLYAVN